MPDSAPTSAKTLIAHLERQVLPRVSSFLDRIKASQREREQERLIREQQDSAFQQSAMKDRERIEAKIALERKEAEARRRDEEIRRREFESRAKALEESNARKQTRMHWRRWARRTLTIPDLTEPKDGLRIAVRLPTEGRVIRHFPSNATLTALYTYVDTQLIPHEYTQEEDPRTPPIESATTGEDLIEEQLQVSPEDWWGFKLVLAFPRREIKWQPRTRLSDVEALKGGGQVVVEMSQATTGVAIDEDGYSTDESD